MRSLIEDLKEQGAPKPICPLDAARRQHSRLPIPMSRRVFSRTPTRARPRAILDVSTRRMGFAGWRLPLLLALVLTGGIATAQPTDSPPTFPDKQWVAFDRPESVGYDSERLDVIRAWLKTQNTTAMLVSVGGKVLFEYSDVSRVVKSASVRKSVLAMLYGKYVTNGMADLNATIETLGVDDKQPFESVERYATLRHLLTARSEVYLPSGNTFLDALTPRRGSQVPGTHMQYQNWDFNAAGTAFEKLSGRNIYDALESDLARPLGMQDFSRAEHAKDSTQPISVHPEYHVFLSTRDLARLGLLMLREGQWAGEQVLPPDWSKTITTLVTPAHEVRPRALGWQTSTRRWGYGMYWWVWDAPDVPGTLTGPYQGAYTAMGAWGQYLTVLPALDMVIAHTVAWAEDQRLGRAVPDVKPEEYDAVLHMLVAAHR